MSVEKTTLSSLLCGLVTGITGELSIVAQQNSPRPAEVPYSTVYLFNSLGIGWSFSTFVDEDAPGVDVVESVQGTRQLSFSFNFFRAGAFTTANKFRTLLCSSESLEFFKANGLGLATRGAIRDLSENITEAWEERAQVDIDFYVVDLETLIIRAIESLEMTAKFQSSGIEVEETINIP